MARSHVREDEIAGSGRQIGRTPANSLTRSQDQVEEKGKSITIGDLDLLDCPICVEPLCSPIYQCDNGHLACGLCCSKINNECPSCCLPIGFNRCRGMEKVIESITFSCKNLQYGCTAKVSYNMKLQHESTCSNYTPCSCPYPGCEYIGVSSCVYAHFAALHSSYSFSYNRTICIRVSKHQTHFFLGEWNENTLFVLNHIVEPFGRLVNVVCIAPASSKNVIPYDLTVNVGEVSVNFKSVVDVMPKWIKGSIGRNYLIVPRYFADSKGITDLKLTLGTELEIKD